MQFKRQKAAEVSVNLTSLIDVVFLLLIFFMVSTSFTKESHLSLDLPEASGEANESQTSALEIIIDAAGHYALNGQTLASSDVDTLKRALSKTAGDDREVPMTITADAKAPHQAVITAMDAAGQLGFNHLSLTTRLPEVGDK